MAISFGCIALIINGGIIYNIFRGLREDAIYGRHGHIQIHKQGYLENHASHPFEYKLPNQDYNRLKPLLFSLEHVEKLSVNVEFSGLITAGDKNISFLGLGVEADIDATAFSRQLITIKSGKGLSNDDPYGVILGIGLAAKIDAQVGDYVRLMVNTATGTFNAIDVQIRGIFEGGSKAFDDWVLKIPFQTAQELLSLEAIDSVILFLDKTKHTERVKNQLMTLFYENNLDIELQIWSELALFYNQVIQMFGRELNIIKTIISIVVVLSILNTMSMSIFERTSEIGTIMAMGTKRRKVFLMFLLEALILGLFGGILGVIGGIGLAKLISYIGIPMPPPPASTRPFTARVDIVSSILYFSFLLSVIASVIAAIFPAYKASRLQIVDALRYV